MGVPPACPLGTTCGGICDSVAVILAARGWGAGDRLVQPGPGVTFHRNLPPSCRRPLMSPFHRRPDSWCFIAKPPDHPDLEKMYPAGFRFSQECGPSECPPPAKIPHAPTLLPIWTPCQPGKRRSDGRGVQCVASSLRSLCKLIPKSQCRLKKFTCAGRAARGQ